MQHAYSELRKLTPSIRRESPVTRETERRTDIRIFPGVIVEGEGKNWHGMSIDGRKFTGYWFPEFLVLQNDNDKKDVMVLTWDRTPINVLRRDDFIIINPRGMETLFVL